MDIKSVDAVESVDLLAGIPQSRSCSPSAKPAVECIFLANEDCKAAWVSHRNKKEQSISAFPEICIRKKRLQSLTIVGSSRYGRESFGQQLTADLSVMERIPIGKRAEKQVQQSPGLIYPQNGAIIECN